MYLEASHEKVKLRASEEELTAIFGITLMLSYTAIGVLHILKKRREFHELAELREKLSIPAYFEELPNELKKRLK